MTGWARRNQFTAAMSSGWRRGFGIAAARSGAGSALSGVTGGAARNARLGGGGRAALGAAAALLARIDAHALDPARIGIENFDLEGAGARHQFAATGTRSTRVTM